MSDHPITGTQPTGPTGFMDLLRANLRSPETVLWDQATLTATFRFTPDLTASEAATFADLLATVRTRDVQLTPAEYQAIKPDIALLRTFAGINSPTLAQTAAATKAQSRILRALLRDG